MTWAMKKDIVMNKTILSTTGTPLNQQDNGTRGGYIALGMVGNKFAVFSLLNKQVQILGPSDCWRRFKIEPPCRLNFEPGLMANL
jgi:hypothetical protein